MVLLCDEAQVEARFGLFRDSAILMEDRCMVCVERTIGSEIVLDTPDGSSRGLRRVESRFSVFGDDVSVGGR
jgi:hypothetical protein